MQVVKKILLAALRIMQFYCKIFIVIFCISFCFAADLEQQNSGSPQQPISSGFEAVVQQHISLIQRIVAAAKSQQNQPKRKIPEKQIAQERAAVEENRKIAWRLLSAATFV